MPPKDRDSFVVRIWWEGESEDQLLWRGWVQHAITGKSRYFHDLADLKAFVERYTGPLSTLVAELEHPRDDKEEL